MIKPKIDYKEFVKEIEEKRGKKYLKKFDYFINKMLDAKKKYK